MATRRIVTSMLDYWIHTIIAFLTDRENAAHQARINILVNENDRILHARQGEDPRFGFIYEGSPYRLSENAGTMAMVFKSSHLPMLEPSLVEKMQSSIDIVDNMTIDMRRLKATLFVALKNCGDTHQDIRDMLPDSILEAFPEDISDLPRLREVGYAQHQMDSMELKRWDEAIERIHYYLALRIVNV